MRGLVVAGLAWALLGACTRANPAFGEASSSTGGVDPTKASADASDATASDTRPVDTLGEGTSTDLPSSEAESGPEPSTSGATTGGAPLCDDESTAERSLEVTVDGQPHGDCAPVLVVSGPVVATARADLRVLGCGDCSLCLPSAPEFRFKTEGIPMPIVDGVGCVEVVVARTANCAVRSIAVTQVTEHRPLLVSATDTVGLPPTLAFPDGLEVPRVEELCVRDGCADAGDYALGFGTASYGPGTQESNVALFDGGFEFDLTVDRAGLDENCEQRIAWDALGVVL